MRCHESPYLNSNNFLQSYEPTKQINRGPAAPFYPTSHKNIIFLRYKMQCIKHTAQWKNEVFTTLSWTRIDTDERDLIFTEVMIRAHGCGRGCGGRGWGEYSSPFPVPRFPFSEVILCMMEFNTSHHLRKMGCFSFKN